MMRFSCDRGVYNLHIGWIDACWQFCAVLGNIRPILAALVVFQLNISGYKIKACYAPGFRLKRRGDWSAASASTAICENSLWKVMNDQCCCKCAINIGHGVDLRRLHTDSDGLRHSCREDRCWRCCSNPTTCTWVTCSMFYFPTALLHTSPCPSFPFHKVSYNILYRVL